jgi:hypothetical protein
VISALFVELLMDAVLASPIRPPTPKLPVIGPIDSRPSRAACPSTRPTNPAVLSPPLTTTLLIRLLRVTELARPAKPPVATVFWTPVKAAVPEIVRFLISAPSSVQNRPTELSNPEALSMSILVMLWLLPSRIPEKLRLPDEVKPMGDEVGASVTPAKSMSLVSLK